MGECGKAFLKKTLCLALNHQTDYYHTEKGRSIICKGRRKARSSCLAGAVGCEGIRQAMCASVS